jgi:hypothetical protein
VDEIMTRGAHIHAASAWLMCFDEPQPAPPSLEESLEPASMEVLGESAPLFDPGEQNHEQEPPPAPVDVDTLRREFEEELAAALLKQQEAHEVALRLARSQWLEQETGIGQRMAEGLESAFEALRADVARILTPFVAREVEQRASEDLVGATRRAFADEEAPAIRLEGPRDLMEKITQSFTAQSIAATLIEADGVDVKIDLSHTRIETRLDAWMRRLCESRSGAA